MRVVVLILSLASLVAVTACAAAAPSGTADGRITVREAWVRPAGAGQTSAAYLTIANGSTEADTLVGVSTPSAASASVHQTTTDANGMTGMHEATIAIPAGQSVTLDPGGYHLMLIDLTDDLAPGSTVRLTLTFEDAGPVNVEAEVRAG